MRELCWLRGLWWTLRSFLRTGQWSPTIGGHLYQDEEADVRARVTTSKCVHCGSYHVSWRREPY